MSTSAFRDLHLAYPGQYLTDFRVPSGAEQIFENNPYITKIADNDPDARHIRLDYSEIHRSGTSGRAFAEAHTMDLAKKLGIEIPITKLSPDIFLSETEKNWPNPVALEHGYIGKYWVINAGIKSDYTLKFYHGWQRVVDLLNTDYGIRCVQVGQLQHDHPPLKNALDMRGKTDLRQLFRLSYHAQGALCAVSLQMVIMMALEKPCVVVAGAREGVRWQIYPKHQFLYSNSCVPCAPHDGCWRSKKEDCVHKESGNPLCMDLIKPEDITRAVMKFYEGGLCAI